MTERNAQRLSIGEAITLYVMKITLAPGHCERTAALPD
jgi:hypothetical protein